MSRTVGTVRVLFDTDVLIDHLTDASRSLPVEPQGVYSSISRAELYSGGGNEAVIDHLLDNFQEIPVDRSIAEEAGRIRRTTRVKLPDALIAATALVTGSKLMTRNVRDFRKVEGVRLY